MGAHATRAQRCSTKPPTRNPRTLLPLSPALHARRPSPPPSMDAGECSTSNPPQQCPASASSPAGAAVWARLGDRPPRPGSLRVPSPARFLDSHVGFLGPSLIPCSSSRFRLSGGGGRRGRRRGLLPDEPLQRGGTRVVRD
jgi:hypothetical protein